METKLNVILSEKGYLNFDDLEDIVEKVSPKFENKDSTIFLFHEHGLGNVDKTYNSNEIKKRFKKIQKYLKKYSNIHIYLAVHEMNCKTPFTFGYIISSNSVQKQRKRNFNELDTGHDISEKIKEQLTQEAKEMDKSQPYLFIDINDKKIELRICSDIYNDYNYKNGHEPYISLVPSRNLFTCGDISKEDINKMKVPSKVVIINEDTLLGNKADIFYNDSNNKIGISDYINDIEPASSEKVGEHTLQKYKKEDKMQNILSKERIQLYVLK